MLQPGQELQRSFPFRQTLDLVSQDLQTDFLIGQRRSCLVGNVCNQLLDLLLFLSALLFLLLHDMAHPAQLLTDPSGERILCIQYLVCHLVRHFPRRHRVKLDFYPISEIIYISFQLSHFPGHSRRPGRGAYGDQYHPSH